MPKMRPLSVERVIDAPASVLFDLLSDPSMHPVIDGSGSVRKAATDNPDERLELGSVFSMSMHIGADYKMVNTVVEFEKDRLICWEPWGRQRWRYELVPVSANTTKVIESFDTSRSRAPLFYRLYATLARHRRSMARSLANLDQLATTRFKDPSFRQEP